MAKKDLSKLSDEDLEQELFRLQTARGEAEMEYKEQQMAVQAEVSKRADQARMNSLLDTLSDDDKAALRQHLGEEG